MQLKICRRLLKYINHCEISANFCMVADDLFYLSGDSFSIVIERMRFFLSVLRFDVRRLSRP